MIAGQRQSGNDGFGVGRRQDAVLGQRVAHDAIVHFGVERALVDGDARAAMRPLLKRVAEAGDDISLPVAVDVL